MGVKRATLEIEATGQLAWFETEIHLSEGEIVGPAVAIEVADFAEGLEIIETVNRSRAQRKRKPTEAPTETVTVAPPAGKDDPVRVGTVKAEASEPARLNAKAT